MGEEGFADALAAILGKENRFSEVADSVDVVTGFDEGFLELRAFIAEWQAGGGTDDAVAVKGEHDEAAGAVQVSAEVVPLIIEGAVVEVGEVAKNGDAELAEGIEVRGEVRAVEGFEAEGHGGKGGVIGSEFSVLSCQ
jgi:hypothetical protein